MKDKKRRLENIDKELQSLPIEELLKLTFIERLKNYTGPGYTFEVLGKGRVTLGSRSMGARPTHDIVRHKDVPIVRLEDPGYKQYSSSIAWLKEFAEGMNEEIEQDKKSHSEYVSKFDNAIAEVMQLRKFGSK